MNAPTLAPATADTGQDVSCGGDDFAALQELIETGLAGALTEPGF